MIRLLSIFVLAVSLGGCVTYEFEHEFWLNTDGSGSFVVTAPPWVWNAAKNVGEARDPEGTVTEQAVAALFEAPAILSPRVKKVTRDGRPYLTVAADFVDINALAATRAFPDVEVELRREGERLRLSGVWRRPPPHEPARGDEHGLMAVRFHLPSEIFDHRNATAGVERGNILSWRLDLHRGIAGAPIEFGATLGTRSVLSTTLGLFGFAVLVGAGLIAAILFFFTRRGRARRAGPGSLISPPTAPGPPVL